MAWRAAFLWFSLDRAAAFDFDADLKQDLTKWWGKVAFERAVQNAHHDVHLAGYTLCSPAAQHAENTLRKLLRRHQSGGACSELPVQIAQHAWRYKEEELSRCLDLAPGGSCIMACQDFPGLQAALKCDGANLTGIPPPGDCRHQFDPDIVHAPSGSLRGLLRRVPLKWPSGEETSSLVRTFWGIPYGEEPVRFQAAKAKAKWTGVRTSADFYVEQPVLCPNLPPLGRGGEVREDCLQLHVYAPQAPAPKTRPVFIFLIPGGFIGTDFFQKGWYDAARFAVRNDAIFISVGYRSGFLGHWVHEQLAEEDPDGSTGNYEALDQRLALQWVQKNIKSFGGDPGRVTLAGHSSGAFSVNFHLLSPGSRGLFAHGILEGTALDSGWYYSTKEDGLRFYATLAEQLGCSGADQIRCLRALPVDSFYNFSNVTYHEELGKIRGLGKWGLAKGLAGAAWSALGFEGSFRSKGLQLGDVPILAGPLWPVLAVGYVVDGSEAGLPAPPRQLYESGRVNPAKVYLNHGTDEGTVFALIMYAAYPWYEAPSLSHAATDEIMTWAFNASVPQLYPHGRGDSAPFYRMSRAIADSTFVCPHRRYATALSKLMPQSVFYAETTFAGDDMQDSNWLSAVIHRDLSYFVGAWHMNQVLWIFGVNDTLKVCNSTKPTNLGFDYASWRSEDELMHQLVNCNYALFAHCGSPDASSNSSCAQDVLKLHSCRSTYGLPHGALTPRPFPPFEEAEGGARFAMTPYGKPKLVSPSAEEERVCAWWDDAAPTHFITSACRGCAAQHVKDRVVGGCYLRLEEVAKLLQPRRPLTYVRAAVPSEAQFRTWDPPVQPAEPRLLRVGLIGPPNAGKSSLMNIILDNPISAVSPKVNTTRENVRGVKTIGHTQLVFLDVPGIIPSHEKLANRELVAQAWQGYQECDVCLLVIDVVKRPNSEIFDVVRKICPKEDIGEAGLRRRMRSLMEVNSEGERELPLEAYKLLPPRSLPGFTGNSLASRAQDRPPVTLVLNKVDKASEMRWVMSRDREFRTHGQFDGIFYTSALKANGIVTLLEHLKTRAKPRPWLYPAEMITTMSHTEQVKQVVNTHIFKRFNSDVPYKIEQQTVGWTPRLDGSLVIEHEVIVKDSVVARMILGVRNSVLHDLKQQVSDTLQLLWGIPVEARIWVRPLKQRLSKSDLAQLGYEPRSEPKREPRSETPGTTGGPRGPRPT
ncbi:ache [Symbiodinium sp. CCMP2592]|nr:ache [Symbiodinium sp. CCMP2592]